MIIHTKEREEQRRKRKQRRNRKQRRKHCGASGGFSRRRQSGT
jgi:hypothetical protein